MSSRFTHVFVMLTFIFALFEQTLAYAQNPCDMTTDTHVMMSDSNMSHVMSDMPHSMSDMDEGNNMDCCDADCTCPTNACSNLSFIPPVNYSDITALQSSSLLLERFSLKSTFLKQAKRPPKLA